MVRRQAFWLGVTGQPVGGAAAVTVVSGAVAVELAPESAVAAFEQDTSTLGIGRRTHKEPTALVGTVARRSSRTSRIPCAIEAHNLDKGTV